MAPKFLSAYTSASGTSSSVKYFEVRLDNDYIVFRGSEDEAASVPLSGSVVLCLVDTLDIRHINLTLSGMVHMSYATSSAGAMSGRKLASKEKTFFEKSWTFRDAGKGRHETLTPDNYEFPFNYILEGALPESIEGMKEAWIIYRLKAEICRRRGKDIIVRKPLRIVRTLDASALELTHAMSVENIWPNKIEYSISIPSKAVIFGSYIQVDFRLIPLLKGLTMGNISTQVKEEQEFVVDPEWNLMAPNGGMTKHDRVVAYDNYKVNPEADSQILDEQAEGFQFTRYLELPKSLNKCVQDCNVKGIKVRHKVKFNVQLHNPDGHVSELRANLPVSFYISPNLPINENNDLVDQAPQAARAAIENDIQNCAPPLYGEHHLDQLYSEVDQHGYQTPGGALSTPGTPFGSHSRNISSENLTSLNSVTVDDHISAAALSYRLQNLGPNGRSTLSTVDNDGFLRVSSGSSPRRNSAGAQDLPSDYFTQDEPDSQPRASPQGVNGTVSAAESVPISRRASEEDEITVSGARTPFPQYAHMEDLTKVPSYSTAVRTPLPRSGLSSRPLPTYGDATSRSPPSLTQPPTAHLRNQSRSVSLGTSFEDRPMNRHVGNLQEQERQLRSMQQRARPPV